MQITGSTSFVLPQVKNFSFLISGIDVQNLNYLSFIFGDTGNKYLSFDFLSGFISTDKYVSTYNTTDKTNIYGYVNSSGMTYSINDVYGRETGNFSNLNRLYVVYPSGNSPVFFDFYAFSPQINYSLSFPSSYSFGGVLTGTITSDTAFDIKKSSVLFNNSNLYTNLLTTTGLTGKINSGTNNILLQDIDPSNFEYVNKFLISLSSAFGDVGGSTSTYRGNFYNRNAFTLTGYDSNTYSKSGLFDGAWSGNKFTYTDVSESFDLNYYAQNTDYIGNVLTVPVSIKFEAAGPSNSGAYKSEYVTGFNLTSSGSYSGRAPTANFSSYYYVDGIPQALNNLLFSTGCSSTLNVNYSGNATGAASGYLTLRSIYLSGLYGVGINSFKGAFEYTSYSNGSGYTGAPVITWGTGGGCFSLPDRSGESGQFKKIHNTSGVIYTHAGSLTGIVLVSGFMNTGYRVTGLTITNIGSGYNDTFPPKVSFIRWTGDSLTSNASGTLSYKKTGLYNFTGSWNITYNFLDSNNNSLNKYTGYYSGDIALPYDKNNMGIKINLSGLDHTSPISGLLTVSMGYGSNQQTVRNYIYRSRAFDTATGAMT